MPLEQTPTFQRNAESLPPPSPAYNFDTFRFGNQLICVLLLCLIPLSIILAQNITRRIIQQRVSPVVFV